MSAPPRRREREVHPDPKSAGPTSSPKFMNCLMYEAINRSPSTSSTVAFDRHSEAVRAGPDPGVFHYRA